MFCGLLAALSEAAPLSAGPKTMDGLRSFCHCSVLVSVSY